MSQTPRIELEGVARRFGPRWAVARVDLTLEPGASWMLTGANGSGKSTLLRCLATALRPHQGTLRYGGRDLWTHRREIRPEIAYLAHQLHLYDDLSQRDNLVVWARMGGLRADVDALLHRVGLDPTRRDPVRALSAGMKRRLALARVLLKAPRLLLLDEPFGALDPDGRQLVIEVVREIQDRGATLVLATHLPSSARHVCAEALVMEAGQITWRGASGDLP